MSDKLRTELRGHLLATAGVAALVGARVYPGWAPTGAPKPYVVQTLTSTDRVPHLGGSSGLVNVSVELDVYADSTRDVDRVAEQLRLALDAYQSARFIAGDLAVSTVQVVGESDEFLDAGDGSGTPIYVRSLEVSIWYAETIPQHAPME